MPSGWTITGPHIFDRDVVQIEKFSCGSAKIDWHIRLNTRAAALVRGEFYATIHLMFLATSEGQPKPFMAAYGLGIRLGSMVWISDLGTDTRCQREGMAGALMCHAVDFLSADHAVKTIRLQASGGRSLYERLGFEKTFWKFMKATIGDFRKAADTWKRECVRPDLYPGTPPEGWPFIPK